MTFDRNSASTRSAGGRLRGLAVSLLAAGVLAALAPAAAQAQAEQFIPVLSYRTGTYAPNGIPFANGFVDYLKLVNARDGGINGVKIVYEECETGYATDRGVECYERLKGKGPTGAAAFHPLSTGITFALTDKTFTDKIPLITGGYGLSASAEGRVFKYNFILGGSYWVAADIVTQHIAAREGGFDKLRGKKIAYVYHDSPYGKEAIPLLTERSKMHGFELLQLPVTHPGVEQKATWLQIRQQRPDYVILWGWGVMNSTAVKEAVATGYPRDKMYGGWYAGAEPDVKPAGEGAKGYTAVTTLAPSGKGKVHADIQKLLHDKNQGTGPKEEIGDTLYNRGLVHAMLTVEAIRKAQERHGKKPLTGEQVRWGLENLDINPNRIKQLGFEGYMLPVSTSCADHMGTTAAMMHRWDGRKFVTEPKIYQADMAIIKPMIDKAAKQYATEKKLQYRDCAKDAG
jgi:branched-chain amino acid transport system substrate-binding protein